MNAIEIRAAIMDRVNTGMDYADAEKMVCANLTDVEIARYNMHMMRICGAI